MIVLSQGPTVHCIVMGRISSHIHLQDRGWQPTSTTESTTPIVHLRGSSRWEEQSIVNRLHPKARARLVERALAWVKVSSTADGQNTQSATSHSRTTHGGSQIWTWVPHGAGPLKKEVLPQSDAPGGAVTRSMSSENQVRLDCIHCQEDSNLLAQDKCVLDCHRSAVLGTDGTIGPQVWISPSRGTVLWLPLPVGQGQLLSAAPASTSSWYYPCVF